MAHQTELQRFIGTGETRQLYAEDRRNGRIVYMGEGQAEALREGCRSGTLICPIKSCENRALTTYGGTRKRHHFKHLVRGTAAHGPESYYHHLGKSLIGQHLQERYPDARVVVDHEALDNGQKPDVLVDFSDGRRFAFELQYSSLTVAEWRRRHRGYAEQGVVDVWIFGHLPPHLRPSRYRRETRFAFAIKISELAAAIRDSGSPIRFFSPDERRVATVLSESGERFVRSWGAGELVYEDLAVCEIRERRFWTPTDELELAAQAEREENEGRERAQEAAREAAELRRAQAAARAARLAEEWAAWQKTQRSPRLAAWRQAAPKFLALVGLDSVPEVISQELKTDWGTLRHPAHWHARFVYKHLQRRIGETFTYSDAIRDFYREQPYGKEQARRAVGGYLFHLRRLGYVLFDAEDYWIESEIRVVADLSNPPDDELARRLLRLYPMLDDGWLVLGTERGQPVRRLRPARADDAYVDASELRQREQEVARGRHEWLDPPDPAARLRGETLLVERVAETVEVITYVNLSSARFQEDLVELAATHPGQHPLLLRLMPSHPRGLIREIDLACRVSGDAAFADAVHELARRVQSVRTRRGAHSKTPRSQADRCAPERTATS